MAGVQRRGEEAELNLRSGAASAKRYLADQNSQPSPATHTLRELVLALFSLHLLSHKGWATEPHPKVTPWQGWGVGADVRNGKCDAPSFHSSVSPTHHGGITENGTLSVAEPYNFTEDVLISMVRQLNSSWFLDSGALPVG